MKESTFEWTHEMRREEATQTELDIHSSLLRKAMMREIERGIGANVEASRMLIGLRLNGDVEKGRSGVGHGGKSAARGWEPR